MCRNNMSFWADHSQDHYTYIRPEESLLLKANFLCECVLCVIKAKKMISVVKYTLPCVELMKLTLLVWNIANYCIILHNLTCPC